jgi:hypothetical protein
MPRMSLFPAYFGARKSADDDPAPVPEPENESRTDVFNLIPPRAEQKYERPADTALPPSEPVAGAAAIEARNTRPVGAMDLTRLSIDDNGQLYWDGKPVEVRRRLTLSRGQVVGTALIALFIVGGALSSGIQAAATVHDWACRAGWASGCVAADPTPVGSIAPPRVDIPL